VNNATREAYEADPPPSGEPSEADVTLRQLCVPPWAVSDDSTTINTRCAVCEKPVHKESLSWQHTNLSASHLQEPWV